MNLTSDLLTSKSYQFAFVLRCTYIVNQVKFIQVVYEILWEQTFKMYLRMDTQKNRQPKNMTPPASNGGARIKT